MIVVRKRTLTMIVGVITIGIVIGAVMKYVPVPTFGGKHLTVVVDAGHGAPDGGAVGIGGTVEKDVNLAIAEKVQEVLEGKGISVIMTRTTDDGLWSSQSDTIRKMKVEDMNRRLQIIKNSKADLFLSIHMNSFSDTKANGLHVFYSKNHPEGEQIAEKIQGRIAGVTGAKVHAVKTADESLFLMKNPPMTAVLAECGFLSNEQEEKKLIDVDYQARIAWAIAEGVEEYYNEKRV